MIKRLSALRVAGAVAAAAVIGGSAYAFTASNTVPNTNVGAGSGTVSGFAVSNLHYGLNVTTPTNVDSLTFNVSPVIPSTSSGKVAIQVQLSAGGPKSYSCTTNTAGDTVTCPTTSPQLTADELTSLTVVAAQ